MKDIFLYLKFLYIKVHLNVLYMLKLKQFFLEIERNITHNLLYMYTQIVFYISNRTNSFSYSLFYNPYEVCKFVKKNVSVISFVLLYIIIFFSY